METESLMKRSLDECADMNKTTYPFLSPFGHANVASALFETETGTAVMIAAVVLFKLRVAGRD